MKISIDQLKSLIQEVYQEIMKERHLSASEKAKQERIIKKLKAKVPEFKQKYGKRAKEVMYAVATKMAEKNK